LLVARLFVEQTMTSVRPAARFERRSNMPMHSFGLRALWRAALVSLMVAAAAVQARPAKDWAITNLGEGFPRGSQAVAINNRGEVGGYARVPGAIWPILNHAVLWQNGVAHDLGAALGSPPGETFSEIGGINDRGMAVASGPDGLMLWKDGAWSLLGIRGFPYDISNSGAIAGTYIAGDGVERPFLYRRGVLHDLGSLGGPIAAAQAVNDRGLVVGMAWRADLKNRGFVYQQGVMKELGTFGGERGGALDVNNRGDIVGFAQDASGRSIAFVTDVSGVLRPVANLAGNSTAWAINERGAIVGSSDAHGFLVEDGVVTFLEEIAAVKAGGWFLLFPLDINDRGWIVGWGLRHGGSFEGDAFLLRRR
jgi:probable HAF family extracellular repeat protein